MKIIVSITEARQRAITNALDFLRNQSSNTPPKACLSIPQVAKMYGVTESTLRCSIKNGVPQYNGPPTILTEEEEHQLAGYCLNMQQLGFSLSKATINIKV